MNPRQDHYPEGEAFQAFQARQRDEVEYAEELRAGLYSY